MFFTTLSHSFRWLPFRSMSLKYKLKSNGSAKRRFRSLGGSDIFKRARPGKNHLNTGKDRDTIRKLKRTAYTHGSQIGLLKKFLPYGSK
jgi:ribosomal protein L35